MIEKLDTSDIITREKMAAKLNELIDAHNWLEQLFNLHYHGYDDHATGGPSND